MVLTAQTAPTGHYENNQIKSDQIKPDSFHYNAFRHLGGLRKKRAFITMHSDIYHSQRRFTNLGGGGSNSI